MRTGSDETPHTHNWPTATQLRPRTLATERSISPVMMTRVNGNAISAIGMASSVTNRQKRGLATPSMVNPPTTATSMTAMTTTRSQEPRTERSRIVRSVMGSPRPKAAADTYGERPVESDGREDQCADRRPLPERVDAEHRQGAADRGEQDRAERGPVHRSAAAKDGDAADNDRRDDVELRPEPRVRVERAEPGGVEDTRQPGQRTAGD